MTRTIATTSEIRQMEPESPYWDGIWQRLGAVEPIYPIAELKGRTDNGRHVLYMRNGRCIRRSYVVPRDAQSQAQIEQRQRWGTAQARWRRLDDVTHAGWREYALRHCCPGGLPRARAGFNVYVKTQMYRQAMGIGLSGEPPRLPPPPAIVAIEQLPAGTESEFAFRLRCGATPMHPVFVLVELTPPMPTLRRKPRPADLRWACDPASDSFVEMAVGEEEVCLYSSRFSVPEGRRFGVRLRLITHEGVAASPSMAEFRRQMA